MSRLLLLCACLLLAACAATPKRDLQLERLQASLANLESDPAMGELAGGERAEARQALARLAQATSKERPNLLYLAERRVEVARTAAQAEMALRQSDQLDRERDRILLEATRRDAEIARLEAEKLRLQSLARAEEAARANVDAEEARRESELSSAEADQARRLAAAQATEAALARREAELAGEAADSLRQQLESMTSQRDARGEVMTLSGAAFASGSSALRAEARANLGRVVEFVRAAGSAPVQIEGYTDDRGGDNLNQALSQKRAEAVRAALIEEGIDAARLTAVGMGKSRPVADNGSADGRARNRRVEIVIAGGG
jgi:outer membrane protein OmpA-like peptidoglycan-associated protein